MTWRVLAVAVLFVLAGCSGFGGGTETETLTPAPVPTDVPEEGPGSTLAPGVWADGRFDLDRLVSAHRRALSDRSFVWRASRNRSGRVGNVTTQTGSHETIRLVNDTHYYRTTNDEMGRIEGTRVFYTQYAEYADGTQRFVRALAFNWNERLYGQEPVSGDGPLLRNRTAMPIERYFDVESVDVRPITVDGERRYRVTGSEPRGIWVGQVTNYSVRATVTPAGLVTNLSADFTLSQGGSIEKITYRYRIEQLGNVTIDQPEWVPEVRAHVANGTDVFPTR